MPVSTGSDTLYEALLDQLSKVRYSISLLESSPTLRSEDAARLELYWRHEERLASEVDALEHRRNPKQW